MSARLKLAAALAVVTLTLAGCGDAGIDDLGRDPRAGDATTAPTTAAPTTAPTKCSNPTQSYNPLRTLPTPGRMPAGSTMAAIRQRGYLIAGVSGDTWLMGARNPLNGKIEGFDIDVVKAISQAIFGQPDHIQLRVMTSDQRIPLLQSGKVDVVVRTFSMTCDRWKQIAFSAEYYQAGQKVLVPSGSKVTGLGDLSGKRVCAPAGTTTLTKLESYPQLKPVPAATHTQCLALFQEGKVDAITGDDTVLAGLAAQDPYAKIVGKAISVEPYGVGVAASRIDFVQFVNAVLAKRVADGEWKKSYQHWLASHLGANASPPKPVYGRSR